MPILLTDLINRVPPDVESKVKWVRDQARASVQGALGAECRLALRTRKDAQQNRAGAQIKILVEPGYPALLQQIVFPDDFDRMILLGRNRVLLEQARWNASGLLNLREELLRLPEPERWVSISGSDLEAVENWVTRLLKVLDEHDPLKIILAVRQDFLGIYECDGWAADQQAIYRATIRLYWGVIGLVSQLLGCRVEDLALVVLSHELAHAYTHLGADIQGLRWAAFDNAETELTEGLAQYYTDRVLRRLDARYAGALGVFLSMLPHQPDAYRAHEPWLQNDPEAVRRAALEVRRWHEQKLSDFNRRLQVAQTELSPKQNAF